MGERLSLVSKVNFTSVLSWGTKGSLAILEYGLISGCNFFTSVLLARWLTPDQYGAFALAFSVFVLLTVLYQAIVLEPMSVYGGAMATEMHGPYLKALFWIHAALSILVVVCLGMSVVITNRLHMTTLQSAFLGLTLAAPLILLLGLSRRAYYIRLSPGPAVLGAGMYSLVIIIGLAVLRTRLSAFLAFGLMGAGALVSSLFLLFRLGNYLDWKSHAATLSSTWRDHWHYGRWATLSAVFGWAPAYACYPLITWLRGTAGTAELKALMNISAPVIQTFMALSVLILPYAAGSERDHKDGMAICRNIALIFVAAGIAYWIVMMSMKTMAFRMIYGGKYQELMPLLPLFVVESLVWCIACAPTIVLRAKKSPKSVCAANFAATLAFVVVAVPATRAFGISGLMMGIIVADLCILAVSLSLLRRLLSSNKAVPLPNACPEVEGVS
jgi:O-antigen/teichoic acid export membrane protein